LKLATRSAGALGVARLDNANGILQLERVASAAVTPIPSSACLRVLFFARTMEPTPLKGNLLQS
jgi:hypothetical protein